MKIIHDFIERISWKRNTPIIIPRQGERRGESVNMSNTIKIPLWKRSESDIKEGRTLEEIIEMQHARIAELTASNANEQNQINQQTETIKGLEQEVSALQAFQSYGLKNKASALTLSLLLWVSGATIYWQKAPESHLQQWTSWLVGKVLGSDDTWYNRIQEEAKNILVIKKQAQELEQAQKINKLHREIALLEARIEENNKLITLLDEQKKDVWVMLWSLNGGDKKQNIKKELQNLDVYNSTLYGDVKKVRDEVMTDFSREDVQIKLTEGIGGVLHVRVIYKWKPSLGYHANSLKFQNRLTKEWMESWVKMSIHQLQQTEEIEKIVNEHGIDTSKISPISRNIEKMYNSGNIIITFRDLNRNQTEKCTIWPKDTNGDIAQKINNTLNKFLPSIPNVI